MQAPFELSEGERRLKAIIASFPADSPYWSEAQNRFQFVDRLLTECLGWEKPSIAVEVKDGAGGKADYILGVPPKAVLEAKREALVFNDLPQGKPSMVRKIDSLAKVSRDFADAVHQVIPYCALKGAQIAIICNGPQLAIFQAFGAGHEPLDGECFLFNGFQSYVDHFSLLWTLLSPEGVFENRAHRDLALHRNPRIPDKASTAIAEPTKYRYRNDFQENLRALSSLLLEETEENPDLKPLFYRDCYVPSDANNRHLLLSKQIIESRYKRAGDDGIAPTSLVKATKVNDKQELIISDATLSASSLSRPVVVIGDVGVGKTSFFENLLYSLDNPEKNNTYFIHINLGIKANLARDVKTHVLAEIPSVLRTQHSIDIDSADFVDAIYHADIKTFEKRVEGRLKELDPPAYQQALVKFLAEKVADRDTHLVAALGHLVRGRGKQIILVLDNADQRNFDTQQEAFLIAQELAATRLLLVFVALRPSTFYKSKTTGALSGYQNKILAISPPPADVVVQRRLTFAVRVAEGKVSPAALTGIRLQLGSVVAFLNATLRSIRSNEKIRTFLSNISGGNTRAVIELITDFFGSPNVDSQKIVRIELDEGNYKVPLHEFTKHALLGEYAYYNAQSSLLACNIFDVASADPKEHFLASMIVAYLTSNIGIRDNDGFVAGDQILAEMLLYGFLEDQTRSALRRLATKRLVETPHAHYREVEVPDTQPPEQFHFRATSVGVYHIRFWTGAFEFLDATSTDTPIFDAAVRGEICKLAASFEIKDRYRKADLFRRYLDSQWHAANLSVAYYDFATLSRAQEDSFESVKGFVDGSGGKARRRSRGPTSLGS